MRSGGGAVFCSCRETGFSLLGRLVRSPQPVITKYRQVPTYIQCRAADLHHFCESVFHCNAVPDPTFTIMRIWILLLIKVTATGLQTLYVSIVGPQSPMAPFWAFNFYYNADPDPAFHSDGDPDPASQHNADTDPQPCNNVQVLTSERCGKVCTGERRSEPASPPAAAAPPRLQPYPSSPPPAQLLQ